MTRVFRLRCLDVGAFAQARERLQGREPVRECRRLAQELHGSPDDLSLDWSCDGEQRVGADGPARPALHLQVRATLPLTCQRCLGEVRVPVTIDRHLVFASDEAAAAALDEVSEDDVLALATDFDLLALIEDELLLALPLVPRHEVCPEPVYLSAQDTDFDRESGERTHPFAALSRLKPPRRSN